MLGVHLKLHACHVFLAAAAAQHEVPRPQGSQLVEGAGGLAEQKGDWVCCGTCCHRDNQKHKDVPTVPPHFDSHLSHHWIRVYRLAYYHIIKLFCVKRLKKEGHL